MRKLINGVNTYSFKLHYLTLFKKEGKKEINNAF